MSIILLCLLPMAITAETAKPGKSLEFAAGVVVPYMDNMGGIGVAPSAMINYLYMINPENAIGITLARFAWHPAIEPNLYTLGYGFVLKHWWQQAWGKTAPLFPYASYSILLTQAFKWGVEGNEAGHNTRIALGNEFDIGPGSRLFVEAAWDYLSLPGFGRKAYHIQTVSGFAGLRFYW